MKKKTTAKTVQPEASAEMLDVVDDGNLLRLLNPYHGFEFRPYRIDNKSFPADWATSGIASTCAENCTHCGKCEQILKQVMKYDIDHSVRATSYSLGGQFQPRKAKGAKS